jgi:WD40 repeat protein
MHGLLHTWDFSTGAAFGLPLAGHSKTISVIAFAPDGQFIASASKDRTVRIWDPTAGDAVLALFPNDRYSQIVTLAFSADGTMLLIGLAEDTTTYSYYVHSIKVPSGRTNTVTESAVSVHQWTSPSYPTPDYNAMCDLTMALSVTTNLVAILLLDNKIKIFNMRTGIPSDAALVIPRGPMSQVVFQMVFSPTGRQVASSFAHSPSIYVWDVEDGTLAYLCGGFEATSLAFSPDGGQVATGYRSGLVGVWDLKESRNAITAILEGHNEKVAAMTYSPDGNHLISGSGDETLRIWDLSGDITSSPPAEDLHSMVSAVAFSPDGRCYVVATFYQLEAWNSSTGSQISTITIEPKEAIIAACFCPGGDRIIAVCSYELYVWDLDRTIISIPMRERPDSIVKAFISRPPSIAISHTNAHVAWHVYDIRHRPYHHLFLWDWKTLSKTTTNSIASMFNQERTGHSFECSFACSPDGSHVVIGCDDIIEMVDANSGVVIHRVVTDPGQTGSVKQVKSIRQYVNLID